MALRYKTKEILIVSSEEIPKANYLSSLISSLRTSMIKGDNDYNTIIQINHQYKTKMYKLRAHTITTSTIKDNHSKLYNIYCLDFDAMILIFNKNSNDSLDFLKEFLKNYHKVAGNKLYPTVFVEYDMKTTIVQEIKKTLFDKITLNKCFPIIGTDNFDEIIWMSLFENTIDEMSKENNDAFPYNLVYKEEMKINKCLQHKGIWNIINGLLYIFILLCSIMDLIFIFSMPDFLNEISKVDGVYFGIRLNINVINSLICLLLLKYNCLNENKYAISSTIELIAIILNIISLIVELFLHWRIKHLLNHNENYYAIQIYQGFIVIFYIISYIILKYLGVNTVKSEKNKRVVIKENYFLQKD